MVSGIGNCAGAAFKFRGYITRIRQIFAYPNLVGQIRQRRQCSRFKKKATAQEDQQVFITGPTGSMTGWLKPRMISLRERWSIILNNSRGHALPTLQIGHRAERSSGLSGCMWAPWGVPMANYIADHANDVGTPKPTMYRPNTGVGLKTSRIRIWVNVCGPCL